MKMVTAKHMKIRLESRPPEYFAEIAPALVRELPDGSREYDDQHPAWLAAMQKYRVFRVPLAPGVSTGYPCHHCGGKS